jgi:hypothetical protein
MRISIIVLLISSICGLAQARLGETLQQLENRYGKLEDDSAKDYCYQWDFDYYPEVLRFTARKKNGFDEIYFYFLKGKAEPKCSSVKYLKFYEYNNGIKTTPIDVRRLFEENYHKEAQLMKIKESKGIDGDKVINKMWSALWKGPKGEEAEANSGMGWGFQPHFSIRCSAPEWTAFVEKRSNGRVVYRAVPNK